MRSPCAPSTSQRCFSSPGLIAHPRAAAAPRAGARKHRRRAAFGVAAAAAAPDAADENKTSKTSSPKTSSSWTAKDGERSEDFLQALGTRQQYNINVEHGV